MPLMPNLPAFSEPNTYRRFAKESDVMVSKAVNAASEGKFNLKKQSLYEQAIEVITQYITTGNYKVGDALPTEAEFAYMLNVGRNTVREALKTFQALGIIETRQSGMVLRGLNFNSLKKFLPYTIVSTKDSIEDMVNVRFWYEEAIAPLIIENATDEYITNLQNNIDEALGLDGSNMEAVIDCDRRFHVLLSSCVPSSIIREFGNIINEFFFLFPRVPARFNEKGKEITIKEHLSIINSIEKRDESELKASIKTTIMRWQKFFEADDAEKVNFDAL